MIIFTPNSIIKSADVNSNFAELQSADTDINNELRYECAFAAYQTGATDVTITSGNRATLSSELFDLGGDYNTSTYAFTAPVKGIYQMSWTCYSNTISGRSAIWKNTSVYIQTQFGEKTISVTMNMVAGDIAFVRPADGFNLYYYGAVGHNLFSGHLVRRLN